MAARTATLRRPLPRSGRRSHLLTLLWGPLESRVGSLLGMVMVCLIMVGPALAPHAPDALVAQAAMGASGAHPLGTDGLGRDVLSRVLDGGRLVLVVPLLAVVLATVVGGAAGLWGAYARGRVDGVIVRAFDVLLALPPLLMVLVIISGLGSSDPVLVLAIALFFVPRAGRVLRGTAQAIIGNDYVQAAQARGERTSAILAREVLPNMAAPAIADFSLRMTYGVIFVTTLSFLGLGAQPPSSDWGLMVSESRTLLGTQPLAVLAPAIAIALVSVSFNLVADGVSRQLTRDDDAVPEL